jgi:ribosome maturation factor RimP
MGMTPQETVLEHVREVAERVATSEGLELVGVELHGRGAGTVVRIVLDKPGGITHLECQNVSRQVGTILDVEDVIATRYTLEVASPGLDRRLIKPIDFQRFTGRKIKIQLKASRAGRRRFEGLLLGLEEGKIKVETESAGRLEVSPEEIERVNLVPEWGKEFRS